MNEFMMPNLIIQIIFVFINAFICITAMKKSYDNIDGISNKYFQQTTDYACDAFEKMYNRYGIKISELESRIISLEQEQMKWESRIESALKDVKFVVQDNEAKEQQMIIVGNEINKVIDDFRTALFSKNKDFELLAMRVNAQAEEIESLKKK